MSPSFRVCMLGFGEVGQILATDLRDYGVQHVSAWDVQFSDRTSGPSCAAASMEMQVGKDAAESVARADLVISAVTAAQDLEAARSVAPHLARKAFFLDVNSVSPSTKRNVATLIEAAGGRYVEAAIMSPIMPRRSAAPILLGGPHAAAFLPLARQLGFVDMKVFADEVGRASAAKMCRSVMIKGMEALLCESLLAARRYQVEDVVLDSLQNLFPTDDWNGLARYMISRSLIHGRRRAEEMREVARTVADSGFEPWMSSACAQRQDWAADYRDVCGQENLQAMLDCILAVHARA